MLPVFRRFTQSDVPTAPNWISSIFGPLNTFCEQTVQTLTKNLTIGENVQGQKYTVSTTTDSSGAISPIVFRYTGGGQPNCCLVGQISRADGTLITNATSVTSWYLNINTSPYIVTIDYIAGLTASTKYIITFVVL
jgi:hypothetical protein